jgi:hypothetical protein
MKKARFLLVVIGLGAATLGTGYAGQPPKLPAEHDRRANQPAREHPAGPSQGLRAPLEQSLLKSTQPAPLKTPVKRSPPREMAQPALKKAAPGGGTIMNKTETHHEQPAKSPGSGGTAVLGPGMNRGPGASPAFLGGLAAATARRSASALDGTAMKRKP